jgi:hypothetical protein
MGRLVRLVFVAGCVAVGTACRGPATAASAPTAPGTVGPSLPSCGAPPPAVPEPVVARPCPQPAELAQVDREIATFFRGDPTSGVLYCRGSEGSADLTYVQATVYDALLFLKGLHFDAPLPWTPKPLYDWLRGGVKEVVTEVSANDWRRAYLVGGAVHIVYPPTIRPVEPLTLAALPFSLLVHEARHTDGLPSHNCGDLADQRVDDMRAYGVQYYLYKWIAEHSDASGDVRQWADRMAWETRAGPAFCAECQRQSDAAAAAFRLSLNPDPLPATPNAGTGIWTVTPTFTAVETAGVDATIRRVEYLVTDKGTGANLAVQPFFLDIPVTVRAWGSFSYPQLVAYRPAAGGRGAVVTAVLSGVDVKGNELGGSATAQIQ